MCVTDSTKSYESVLIKFGVNDQSYIFEKKNIAIASASVLQSLAGNLTKIFKEVVVTRVNGTSKMYGYCCCYGVDVNIRHNLRMTKGPLNLEEFLQFIHYLNEEDIKQEREASQVPVVPPSSGGVMARV